MKFAKEAWPFVLPFVFGAAILYWFDHPGWALAALIVGLLVLLFFRDPTRRYAGEVGVVLAPADGLITRIDTIEDPEIGPGRYHRIVTFLSVFDVHVQKVPAAGEVIASRYAVGKKVAAFREDAGDVNE
ncbi:MAG TPA: phosphatidylserine decarboxylase, partial [Thermoanaerobaculia bacterium]|nr:phosphatidylserine decarboxylase [Thermoanaerobaculia bacterium]